jgi:guanylate kinase
MTQILDPYHPQANPLLIVISGPSGAGKDVLLKRMKEKGLPFHFVVTTTDRPPRHGEVHGTDYMFVSTEEFERMIARGELLEHANVYGQHKGISKAQVQQALHSGKDVLMRVDVQGAATVRQIVPDALLIFLSSESEEALKARLASRGTETEKTLRTRLETAAGELQRLPEFDYLVINHTDQLDQAVEDVRAIIRAEKCRVHQREITL